MNNSKTSLLPGFFLIGLGLLLLIHKLDLFYFGWPRTYPLIFILVGLTLFISATLKRNGSAVFWGTIFSLFGLFFFLRNFHFIEYYYIHEIWPIFFMILGIAFFILFIVKPQDWGVLIPGSIFLFLGVIFLARNFHYWRALELIQRYWPLLLIVIGVGVILCSLKKQMD